MMKFDFEAIGTHWEIEIKDDLLHDKEASLCRKIQERIEIFDKNYSRFRGDSLVTEISKKAGEYIMPEDFDQMITLYKRAFELTGGLVTPLVGDVLVSSGYDAKYSFVRSDNIQQSKSWAETIEWNKPVLKVIQPSVLDFGACGKGYLVDIVSEIIEKEGINKYLVDAGGDMRHRNNDGKKLRVGLEHPQDKDVVVGVLELGEESLCGSSGNRRKWADMHHIVNPKTLKSPTEILSIWVISETTILSDILTTCLFFVPAATLAKNFKFEYLILNFDYTVEKSPGFKAEIFS